MDRREYHLFETRCTQDTPLLFVTVKVFNVSDWRLGLIPGFLSSSLWQEVVFGHPRLLSQGDWDLNSQIEVKRCTVRQEKEDYRRWLDVKMWFDLWTLSFTNGPRFRCSQTLLSVWETGYRVPVFTVSVIPTDDERWGRRGFPWTRVSSPGYCVASTYTKHYLPWTEGTRVLDRRQSKPHLVKQISCTTGPNFH